MTIRQAVIVAGGLGTRFLPATLTLPKEILPVVDRPMVQYAVEEIVLSGIERVVLISSHGKQSLEDYFDRHAEVERLLAEKGEKARLREVARLGRLLDLVVVRQKEPLGLGHAILAAEPALREEPFAALLPDDIIDAAPPVLAQMVEAYRRYPGVHIAVERVAPEEVSSYGIVDAEPVEERLFRVKRLVEKPSPQEAPSNLAIVGRYILPPQLFDAVRRTPPGAKGEIQITDAIDLLRREGFPVYVYEFHGTRYDVGNPLGALKASVALALQRPDLGPPLRAYLKRLLD